MKSCQHKYTYNACLFTTILIHLDSFCVRFFDLNEKRKRRRKVKLIVSASTLYTMVMCIRKRIEDIAFPYLKIDTCQ